jgi:molybdopterin-guanine dinucleotide biosynthesis protein MobB
MYVRLSDRIKDNATLASSPSEAAHPESGKDRLIALNPESPADSPGRAWLMPSGGTCAQKFGAPVLAVCGFSGSGKTTLLEAVIPHLIARGLAIAAIKHDSHGFAVDKEGKDSERLFRAGATVALRGPAEQFLRRGASSALTLEATLADLARDHDLLLVEGHKDTPLPKLWVGNAEMSSPPEHVTDIQEILPWNSDRLTTLLKFIDKWLPKVWASRPLSAGLLVGGKSTRMGRPKQLVSFGGITLGEIAAHALSDGICQANANGNLCDTDSLSPNLVVLGAGPVPDSLQGLQQLPDAPELVGPIAGLLTAHRWAPRTTWILAACDQPLLSAADIQWLIDQRRPGTWAILPRQSDDHPCPTLALYEPQALTVLERSILVHGAGSARIAELFDHPRTRVARYFTRGLINVNTPEELMAQEKLAEATNQSSMWKKYRPSSCCGAQPNSELCDQAANDA